MRADPIELFRHGQRRDAQVGQPRRNLATAAVSPSAQARTAPGRSEAVSAASILVAKSRC
jgi:hypothetical protein